jgi:hypothetical protein
MLVGEKHSKAVLALDNRYRLWSGNLTVAIPMGIREEQRRQPSEAVVLETVDLDMPCTIRAHPLLIVVELAPESVASQVALLPFDCDLSANLTHLFSDMLVPDLRHQLK